MNYQIQRIDNNIFSINFKNKKNKKILIHVKKGEIIDSKNDRNQEFLFNLINDVASKIKISGKSIQINQVIEIGNKKWTLKLSPEKNPLLSHIFTIIHKREDNKMLRLNMTFEEDRDPLDILLPSLNRENHAFNERALNDFNLSKAKSINTQDCQQHKEMILCTDEELINGIRGKFSYNSTPSLKEKLNFSVYKSPFTVLSTIAFQRYEEEFVGSDNFKTSNCKYCLVLEENVLKLVPRSDAVVSNIKTNKATLKSYINLMSAEVGSKKLDYVCRLAQINLRHMQLEGTPLTPEHIYRLNILINNIETEDLNNLLDKIKTIDSEILANDSVEEMVSKVFTLQESRGLLRIAKDEASKGGLAHWVKEIQQYKNLQEIPPKEIDQLACIFSPLKEEKNLIFTGREIFYPIKSGYTIAGKNEYKPWIDQQELLQVFSILESKDNWDLYHEKLSHVVCKKHLFRPHPTKQYTTGALIPAPLGPDGHRRWMQVDQAVYNGYGMLNYTLKPLGKDLSLPLIKLYRSTSTDAYSIFGKKTIRTDLNPFNLPGYEGLGKTDLYELEDIRANSIPIWVGYLLMGLKALDKEAESEKIYKILSKTTEELAKYEENNAKVLSFPTILIRHNGILNTLFLKNKIDLITYDHLRNTYIKTLSIREDNETYLKEVKEDAEKLIAKMSEIKFDLSVFEKTLQPQIATEIDMLIQELNNHLLIGEAKASKVKLNKELSEKIISEAVNKQRFIEYFRQEKNEKENFENDIQITLTEWATLLIDYAMELKQVPDLNKGKDIHFVGHSLGGSFAQIYCHHFLTSQNRMPIPGKKCYITAFDAPGISWRDNEIFKKFLVDHYEMLEANETKFAVMHQHEAGDPVPTIGTHLGSSKNALEAEHLKNIQNVFDFRASVLKRNPRALHPTIANAKTVHATQFLEGQIDVDYTSTAISSHDLGMMESYETMQDLPKEILSAKGQKLRNEVWQFPLPFSTSTYEELRSTPSGFWIAGHVAAYMAENEPEMIPFLDPMGNFAANSKGLTYTDKKFYVSTVLTSERSSWVQKQSEQALRSMLYPGSDIQAMVKILGGKKNIEEMNKQINALKENWAESRKFIEAIGGEKVTIKTSVGNLDGMILKPFKFLNLLKEAKILEKIVQVKDPESGKFLISKVWVFNDINNEKQVNIFKSMQNMRCFKVGLNYSDIGDELIVGDEKFIKAFKKDSNPTVSKNLKIELDVSNRGVMICGGNMSVYEMFCSEATSFLIRGMNVMLFNPPGFGESQGAPNEETINEGICAAYDTFTKKAGLKEENILIKSLCMSGGWASTLAKIHPNTSIWLDQTYSSFYTLAQSKLKEQLEDTLPKNLAGFIADLIPKSCLPGFDVAKNLSEHKGPKCIMYAEKDAVIPASHVVRSLDYVEDNKPTKIIQLPGGHCQSWYRLKGTANQEEETKLITDQVDVFLGKAGFLNPFFQVDESEIRII